MSNYAYKIDEQDGVFFEKKSDYLSAIKELKKLGFSKMTKGFWHNRKTKQFMYTSEIYFIT